MVGRMVKRLRYALAVWLAGYLLLVVPLPAFSMPLSDGWPTKGHDSRRTAQSEVNGPAAPAIVVRREIANGASINIAATVDGSGTAYFGTWGVITSHGEDDRSRWDKADGQVYAWQPVFTPPPHFFQRWGPGSMDPVPYCYDFEDGWNILYCPQPLGGDLSWWNGTVEGTAVLSPDERTLYVGRGDGKVYALESATGTRRWTFHTCNDVADCNLPTTDPEAGGEIVAGLLLRGADELYLGTWAAEGSGHESNAFYRLDAADGSLDWRYPLSGTLPGVALAAPALSPDGETIYTATWCEPDCPGSLYAFAPDGSLRWPPVELWGEGEPPIPISAWTMAVSSDGTVFVGGRMGNDCDSAMVVAYHPNGTRRWGPVRLPAAPLSLPCANIVGGLALREVEGQTTRIYATTNLVALISPVGTPAGGRLFALDPATGGQPWGSPFFAPDAPPVSGIGNALYPAVSADGVIYFGSSGAYRADSLAYRVDRPGKVLAVSEEGSLLWQVQVEGILAWSHPVIGPDGTLFVGEMKDRLVDLALRPVEDPIFADYDFDPALYAIRDRASIPHYLPLVVR